MSSRAVRKLYGEGDNNTASNSRDESDESEPDDVQQSQNPFDLLETEGIDLNDELEVVKEREPTKMSKKKKKKKSTKPKVEVVEDMTNEHIDACIEEVNKLMKDQDVPLAVATSSGPFPTRSLLTVDYRNLNPENEMRRVFGAKAVAGDRSSRFRKTSRFGGAAALVQPKPNWPRIQLNGLKMAMEEEKGSKTFTMVHGDEYRQKQYIFLQVVESYDPDAFHAVLMDAPYHIDSLLQLSEVFKMQEDLQVAAELIERVLYAFQASFHPSFNFAKGTCQLDYKRQENRALFIAIFKHIQFVSRRACYRTCLEFCKVLLSLDPVNDPMCVLLLVDFYVLMSGEYTFLLQLYKEWESTKNLSQLPNFAYSIPLATWMDAKIRNASTEDADKLLQDALIMFPGVLHEMLDKCGVVPFAEIQRSPVFNSLTKLSQSDSLSQLISLYTARTYHCWKDPDVLTWLERNVREVSHLQLTDPRVVDYNEKRKRRYIKAPRNVLRHIILSEIPEAAVNLPPELSNERILSYDPLPPVDSINIYDHNGSIARQARDMGFLPGLLMSLFPFEDIWQMDAEGGGQVPMHGLMEQMRQAQNLLQLREDMPADREQEEDEEVD